MGRVAGLPTGRVRVTLVRSAATIGVSLAGGLALALWRRALDGAGAPSLAFLTAVNAAPWVFALWTWRRLGAIGRATDNAVVYEHGVRRYGLAMGGTMAVWSALYPRWPLHIASAADLADLGFWLVLSALTSVPIAMWGGYLWGRLMGAVFHVPKPPGGRRPDV